MLRVLSAFGGFLGSKPQSHSGQGSQILGGVALGTLCERLRFRARGGELLESVRHPPIPCTSAKWRYGLLSLRAKLPTRFPERQVCHKAQLQELPPFELAPRVLHGHPGAGSGQRLICIAGCAAHGGHAALHRGSRELTWP